MRTPRRKGRHVPYPTAGLGAIRSARSSQSVHFPSCRWPFFGFVRTGRVEIRTQRGSVVMRLKSQLDCWTTGRSGKESAQHLSATRTPIRLAGGQPVASDLAVVNDARH
jgi:hypothetical protein